MESPRLVPYLAPKRVLDPVVAALRLVVLGPLTAVAVVVMSARGHGRSRWCASRSGSGSTTAGSAMAGWTGPAHVGKGVSVIRYSDRDLAYVEACRTWSSWRLVRFDLSILWQTVRVLLRGEGLRY
jgi:lipopolysaccharide/colanic/teichoic acid biosynthesis glycosyltransferase